MLDFFSIATKGGLVLWSKAYSSAQSSPINSLIQEVLIEERSSTQIFYKDNYAIKWTFLNELDLIFIVITPERPWTDVCFAPLGLQLLQGTAKNRNHTHTSLCR